MLDLIFEPLTAFINPAHRIYFPFLLSSFFIALILYWKEKNSKGFFDFVGGKKAFFSKSAFIDYSWFFIGFWINSFFILPNLISQVDLNIFLVKNLYNLYTPIDFGWDKPTILFTYTITLILAFDLSYYFVHRALHKYKFLWIFHKFHHSATSLNPLTLYRTHPVEYALFGLQKIFVFGFVTSLFIHQFGIVIKPVTFYGVGIGAFVFGLAGANLRHSQIEFKYFDWLENLLVSPYMHQIHHGSKPNQHHSNFGAIFSIWDKIFKTLNKSKNIKEKLSYGI
jgi:sterol desaturase/sphingolipid hydroxylase (fatty acid hydroxylase superfamily)